ncbi:MAG: class I SAM-dependent rRNA methyltransferase [Bacteroides sp.]|nr:class I SAM-dependent rRNA methyltransferase [Bacteroides sp.]MCM1414179.1 class I SAM-dependent rRNA methyltransferase [Bacteroides sp.]MCM1471271.1 class I SAM-dependent rRNA methyltransferase [Bacteroides sp.]
MKYPEVTLHRGKEESLMRFHPWVFSGAIRNIDNGVEEGDVVKVVAADGHVLGVGHYQIGSIAVRMLSWEVESIDIDFFRRRLSAAARLRLSLGLSRTDNDAFRLVHGEGDFLPGLIVDIYGSTAVVQAHSPGMHFARNVVAMALTELDELSIENVYYKSETTLPYKAQLDPQNEYLIGGFTTNVATENGLKFHVDWLKGQKTGFFVDQRDNRHLLEKFARGRRVLNMFCYTGGFSVYALKGGAELVHSVDSSAKAIALTEANVSLNFGSEAHHEAFAVDAFKFLSDMQPGAYDLVVLDPPAFAKHRGAIRNALRGYQKLNAKAMEKMPAGSILFTFSCSQAISREQFRLAVFSAAAQTGRRVRILHQLTQPADHPVNIYHPEGEYLKGLILYIE